MGFLVDNARGFLSGGPYNGLGFRVYYSGMGWIGDALDFRSHPTVWLIRGGRSPPGKAAVCSSPPPKSNPPHSALAIINATPPI